MRMLKIHLNMASVKLKTMRILDIAFGTFKKDDQASGE